MSEVKTSSPLTVSGLAKTFTMHLQAGIQLPVVSGVNFRLESGECAVLGGPSGAGKAPFSRWSMAITR